MPLGIDTPSLYGMIIFVLAPAFSYAQKPAPDGLGLPLDGAALYCWKIGMCSIFTSGVFKIACALVSSHIHRILPRAGLLGSLASVALVLIAFLPLVEIAQVPVAGFVALSIILVTLVARIELPQKIPGSLAALIVGGVVYYIMYFTGTLGEVHSHSVHSSLGLILPDVTVPWWEVYRDSLKYLPIVLPFALATVVGGIDCAESAKSAGDDYHTGTVIAIEGVATLAAAVTGGVIQTTPYIGHPAYKAMGGRSAYVLATALFIGGAGVFGYFGYLFQVIPQPVIFPILVFIGLEITSQSYHATKSEHYPAVAVACLPALAYLVTLFLNQVPFDVLNPQLKQQFLTMTILSGGGSFIITSLLWASLLAAIIDRRLLFAAGCSGLGAICSLFGIMHSPLPGGSVFLPWDPAQIDLAKYPGQSPYYMATAYLAVALTMVALHQLGVGAKSGDPAPSSHES
jgi:AGZA family xanthine/uracil permease-like MFS transporter